MPLDKSGVKRFQLGRFAPLYGRGFTYGKTERQKAIIRASVAEVRAQVSKIIASDPGYPDRIKALKATDKAETRKRMRVKARKK